MSVTKNSSFQNYSHPMVTQDELQPYKLLIKLILSAIQTRHVTLEDAANVLIGEEEEGQTKYKSKKLTT